MSAQLELSCCLGFTFPTVGPHRLIRLVNKLNWDLSLKVKEPNFNFERFCFICVHPPQADYNSNELSDVIESYGVGFVQKKQSSTQIDSVVLDLTPAHVLLWN